MAREAMGPGESTVIGGGRMSTAGATMTNGYLITATSLCDIHYPTSCHVSPEVVPPGLAVAEQRRRAGRDLLVAIVAGMEVTVRVGLGLDFPAFHARGWHTPGVAGVFGAAAAAGVGLALDERRLAHAFGIAGSQTAGTDAQHGTPTIKFHQARAALAGLLAAELAAVGLTAMDDILTHPTGGTFATHSHGGDPAAATAGLGEKWALLDLSLRRWPLSTLQLNVVDCMLDLADGHEVSPGDVATIRLRLSLDAYRQHGEVAFNDSAEARKSARYLAAVALHDRTCGPAQFSAARLNDPALIRFATERIEVAEDEGLAGRAVRVEATLRSGERRTIHRDVPHGESTDPLSREEIREKLRATAAPHLSPERVARVVDLVSDLERQESVAPLLAALSPRDDRNITSRRPGGPGP
jgi:2-methylcitrate dehydratase PrpD